MATVSLAAPAARRSRPRRPAAVSTAARRAPRQARTRARLRMTRRGRLVVTLLLAAVAFAGLALVRVPGIAGTTTTHPLTRAVTVQPGESLWTIAEQVAPGVDPRLTVARLEEVNNLPGGLVQAGQLLVIPR